LNTSFYWHDYETWGAEPAKDKPVQFAGLRTDWNLQPIGEPLVIYARPSNDILPQPQACLITGITPQFATTHGMPESQFITRINTELSVFGTCGAGYNSLRFDDEITRYTLFRNFLDPYAREWQNNNSRWDLIDVMRLAHALRPDGIIWPQPDGVTSFRLEDLTKANNISHAAAHDALSDVRATIELARLLRTKQPRLFDFALDLRDKHKVKDLLNPEAPQPILHVSSKYPAQIGCIAPVLAVATHPTNRNSIIVFDLRADPSLLLDLSVEVIKQRLFTKHHELPNGVERIPLKEVHINRVPMVAPMNTLTPQAMERWMINTSQVQIHAKRLQTAAGLTKKLHQVYVAPQYNTHRDPEQDLYGAFISKDDRYLCDLVHKTPPQELHHLAARFRDARLAPLLFRYQARNFPETLNPQDKQQWDNYRQRFLTDPNSGSSITLAEYQNEIARLRIEHAQAPHLIKILDELVSWGNFLVS